jgi:hypothetical protein
VAPFTVGCIVSHSTVNSSELGKYLHENANDQTHDTTYCEDKETFSTVLRSLDSLIKDASTTPLLLDFHGNHVGSTDGNLSLLAMGLATHTYLVDARLLDAEIPRLAPYLQDRNLTKMVWDGRLGYAELWHRYKIRVENVLDLQLVYVQEKYDCLRRKCVLLSGKTGAMRERKLLSPAAVEDDSKCNRRGNVSNLSAPFVVISVMGRKTIVH